MEVTSFFFNFYLTHPIMIIYTSLFLFICPIPLYSSISTYSSISHHFDSLQMKMTMKNIFHFTNFIYCHEKRIHNFCFPFQQLLLSATHFQEFFFSELKLKIQISLFSPNSHQFIQFNLFSIQN